MLSYFTDSAGEICGRRSKGRLADKGIELRLSVPHESQTNGIAERANRSVLDMTRILLYQSRLPLPFWALAMDMAVWLLNRSPTKALSGNRSPYTYEAYYGRKPERKILRVFGSKCWVWIPKDQRRPKSKLMPTARAMVFVGYNENGSRGFKVWDPLTKKVKIRHSLLFEEGSNIGFGVDPSRKPATAIADESTDGEEDSAEPQEPRLAID